ncbi:HNH endonuclease signature motif containing protein [Phenylobacterium sp.]|uniref:HNH endonuclease n=1 Tax=Phenylobacterium sp. TaxID=1871053 RepID=UPI002E339437|nr:HNH endonuclease signature motif containing protein [Phenylobacterium sp.]HEX3367894.1 HNH endonuclease signature motif containing protein [Phenylobacterium sp.]
MENKEENHGKHGKSTEKNHSSPALRSRLDAINVQPRASVGALDRLGAFRALSVFSVVPSLPPPASPSPPITGITNPTLLIASHIKPWRLCATSNERLDGMNGLLLTPDADLLFDRGFISFKDDGETLVSPRVDKFDLRRLGFAELAIERFGFEEAPAVWRTESFAPRQCGYLDYHRREVFVA